MSYIAIFVRDDLSKEQKIVQSIHAAIEGVKGDDFKVHPSVLLFSVRNLKELEMAKEYFEDNKFKPNLFIEPYFNHQMTSFSLFPLNKVEKDLLSGFKLLKL